MPAYYNEHDKFAAAWLRNLIAAGHIAPGDVDERDIRDVRPDDLRSYTQCHFFAGIGVWSYGLRRAGWADDRPVWTGSCPCQPFSQAGQGGGFADERHLWPAFYHLIAQSRPDVVFGEQVASKDGLAWFDLVQTDMEAAGHAFGGLDLSAAGFGAPHIRQRLYWVGVADGGRRSERIAAAEAMGHRNTSFATGNSDLVVDADHEGPQGRRRVPERADQRPPRANGVVGELADADECVGRQGCSLAQRRDRGSDAPHRSGFGGDVSHNFAGPTNGLWRDADWLHCRDGKWRPVRPGSFPLAHGAPARVGRLRAYGNAVVAPQVEEFVKAYIEATELFGVME